MKESCFKEHFWKKEDCALIKQVGQALPDNAPAQGHLSAFTLIELLVVVLIIGILVAVAVPQYKKAVTKARYANLKPLVKAIADAQEVYYLENGQYTTTLAELSSEFPATDTVNFATTAKNELGYDWGWCGTSKNSSAIANVYCKDAQGQIGYGIYLLHSANYANSQYCIDYTGDASSVPSQICKQEAQVDGKAFGDYLQYRWPR